MLLQFDAVLSLDDVQVGSKLAVFNKLIIFFRFAHCLLQNVFVFSFIIIIFS